MKYRNTVTNTNMGETKYRITVTQTSLKEKYTKNCHKYKYCGAILIRQAVLSVKFNLSNHFSIVVCQKIQCYDIFSLLSFQGVLVTFGLRHCLKLVCWAGLGYWNKGILRTKEGTKPREGGRGGKGGTMEGTKGGREGSSSRLLMKRLVMVVGLIFPPIQPSPCFRKS